MAQWSLRDSAGSVTLDFLLVLPMLLLVLGALWQIDAAAREAWAAHMCARIEAWSLQRDHAQVSGVTLLAAARSAEGRVISIAASIADVSAPAGSESPSSLAEVSLGGVAVLRETQVRIPGVAVQARCDMPGLFGPALATCYLWADTQEAAAGAGETPYRAFVAILARPAWTAARAAAATCVGRMGTCGS